MKIKQRRSNPLIMLATSVAILLPLSSQADNTEFTISGQLSRAITYADDGQNTDVLHVDNNNSGTRIRLKGKTDLNNGVTAGIYWETQYQDNSSSSIGIDDKDNSSTFTSRMRELWFKGDWGTITLGQGNGAANGTSEVDYSGTFLGDYSGNNLDDGLSFVDMLSGPSVKNDTAFSNFDGLSRNDRLRYDLPAFGPVALAVSAGDERSEFALRYSSKFADGGKFGFAVGIVGQDDVATPANNFDQTGASASLLLANGFNITIHFGEKDLDIAGEDPTSTYIKVGKKIGVNHSVAVSFNSVDDLAATGDEAERTNVSYVYLMPDHGVELFGAYQIASLDRAGADFDDVTQISVGSRIKF